MSAGGQEAYDCVIVGAGPAGIFAALRLAREGGLRVALIERGRDLPERDHARRQDILGGWGGAGAFSDGKLNLSTEIGGALTSYVAEDDVTRLIEEVDETFVEFGAPDRLYEPNPALVEETQRRAARAELRLLWARIRHIGTDRCPQVLQGMRQALGDRVEIRTGVEVTRIVAEDGQVRGVELASGESIPARHVIVAPGRSGSDWLVGEARRIGLSLLRNPVDVGVRVELPEAVLHDLTEHFYEVKLQFYSKTFDNLIRTFCMCPRGEVSTEELHGLVTVNGHTTVSRPTANTNFALLVSTTFTEPFDDPIAYGRNVAQLANLLGDGVLVQRLTDLRSGRRSTPSRMSHCLVQPTLKEATPGDISYVLPYRHLSGILEMLEAMDRLAPGVASRHTLLYAVEAKFYSSKPKLSPQLETEVRNLFAVGDGAGVSRGIVQAAASGIVAAREVVRR